MALRTLFNKSVQGRLVYASDIKFGLCTPAMALTLVPPLTTPKLKVHFGSVGTWRSSTLVMARAKPWIEGADNTELVKTVSA